MAISEAYEAKTSAELSEDNLNSQTVKLKTNTEAIFAIADTKRPMSFLNEKKSALIEEKTNQQYSKTSTRKTLQKFSTLQRRTFCFKSRTNFALEYGDGQDNQQHSSKRMTSKRT